MPITYYVSVFYIKKYVKDHINSTPNQLFKINAPLQRLLYCLLTFKKMYRYNCIVACVIIKLLTNSKFNLMGEGKIK